MGIYYGVSKTDPESDYTVLYAAVPRERFATKKERVRRLKSSLQKTEETEDDCASVLGEEIPPSPVAETEDVQRLCLPCECKRIRHCGEWITLEECSECMARSSDELELPPQLDEILPLALQAYEDLSEAPPLRCGDKIAVNYGGKGKWLPAIYYGTSESSDFRVLYADCPREMFSTKKDLVRRLKSEFHCSERVSAPASLWRRVALSRVREL